MWPFKKNPPTEPEYGFFDPSVIYVIKPMDPFHVPTPVVIHAARRGYVQYGPPGYPEIRSSLPAKMFFSHYAPTASGTYQ